MNENERTLLNISRAKFDEIRCRFIFDNETSNYVIKLASLLSFIIFG